MTDPDQPEASDLREPAIGFEWDEVEDPIGVVLEELGSGFTRDQAERICRWRLRQGRVTEAETLILLERVLLWIGGADDLRADLRGIRRPDRAAADREHPLARRIGLRAAVAIKELHPYSRLGRLSCKTLAKVFLCSHGETWRLIDNFRRRVPQ